MIIVYSNFQEGKDTSNFELMCNGKEEPHG